MPIQRGAQVVQVVPTIRGKVVERRFNESQAQMEYLVLYPNADDEPAERWFLESEIKVEE